jgi:hypothetical protein
VLTVKSTYTVKLLLLLAEPCPVVTDINPVVAPDGTVAVNVVEFNTVTPVEFTPLKLTVGVPLKLVPFTVTKVPVPPELGLKPVTVGGVVTVKLVPLVPVPDPFTTVIAPVLAPDGTVALMLVVLFTVYTASVPLNLTLVTAVKLLPVMLTLVPTGPVPGVKLLTVGAGITVNELPLLAEPAGLVTLTNPVVAVFGTDTVMVVLFTIVNPGAFTPLICTCVAHVKPVPVMVIVVPKVPVDGVNELTVGAGITVKLMLLVPVPKALVTDTVPVLAPAGTVVVIVVSFTTV